MVTTAVGVYAFVIDETEIAYIGSSTRNLAGRIYMHGFSFGYEKVNPVDARMRPLLEAGSRIDVWVCINPMVSWNGEMLDGSLAVEQYLIGRFQPPWNTMHRKRGARSGVAATSCFAK
jgi:hypothetical protein